MFLSGLNLNYLRCQISHSGHPVLISGWLHSSKPPDFTFMRIRIKLYPIPVRPFALLYLPGRISAINYDFTPRDKL